MAIEQDALHILLSLRPHKAWLVGGTVRDYLKFGTWPDDVDIATNCTPDQVMAILKAQGMHVEPTGLKHGTVTAVYNNKPYEITTLRKDIATDGRHAEVVFTEDPKEDADRRDFTINALYMDADGSILDFHNGMEDLDNGVVRFIGNPSDRIAEDYLRILRFLRFHTRFSTHPVAHSVLNEIKLHVPALTKLSLERVTGELFKQMQTEKAVNIFPLAKELGVLDVLKLPEVFDETDPLKNLPLDVEDKKAQSWWRLLGIFHENIGQMVNALNVSNKEKKCARNLEKALNSEYGLKQIAYLYGKETAYAVARIKKQNERSLEDFTPPIFPVTSTQVMEHGVEAGPQLGRILKELELWWLEKNFPTQKQCEDKLKERLK